MQYIFLYVVWTYSYRPRLLYSQQILQNWSRPLPGTVDRKPQSCKSDGRTSSGQNLSRLLLDSSQYKGQIAHGACVLVLQPLIHADLVTLMMALRIVGFIDRLLSQLVLFTANGTSGSIIRHGWLGECCASRQLHFLVLFIPHGVCRVGHV
jgi:hypothetical protein